MENRIERHIDIKAPVTKVWQALTDYREFGKWFGVRLENPFVEGMTTRGQITIPGYTHIKFEVVVKKMESEHYFSYTWHPYAADPKLDYSKETPTLVELKLEKISNGTRVTVTESGFEKIPPHRLEEAFRMNQEGWKIQLDNIKEYVENK